VEAEAQLTRAFADDRWQTQMDEGLVEEVSQYVMDESGRSKLRQFLDGFPRRYLKFTPKQKIAEHYKLADKLRSPEDLILRLNRRKSTYELSIMAFDRPFLFAKLTGVLSYFGMNIVRGQAFANHQGIVLDVIEFEDRLQTFKLNKSEIEHFRETLQKVLQGRESLTGLLKKRESSILYQPKSRGSVATFISFDDHSSEKYSIMEIVTQDRFGLLYTISKTISQNGCNIDVALISTEGHKAIDVFYLTQEGKKLSLETEQNLTASMKEGLDRAAA
jgi:[protein-PII] uridylyltransferase